MCILVEAHFRAGIIAVKLLCTLFSAYFVCELPRRESSPDSGATPHCLPRGLRSAKEMQFISIRARLAGLVPGALDGACIQTNRNLTPGQELGLYAEVGL